MRGDVSTDPWLALFTELVQSKMGLFGKLAVAKASAVEGLSVDDAGVITAYRGDPGALLKSLLAKYEEIAGRVSTIFMLVTIRRYAELHPEMGIPPELLRE